MWQLNYALDLKHIRKEVMDELESLLSESAL